MTRSFRGLEIGAMALFFLFSGCATPEYRFKGNLPAPVTDERVPMTLVLVLPPSVCSRTRVVGDIRPSVFHVGESVCRELQEAGKRTYRTVRVVGKTEDVVARESDAILGIRIIGIDGYEQKKIPAVVGYRMTIEWSFSTRDGKGRYVRRLTAVGEDERTFGYVDPRHQASLQNCLEDLGRKVSAEMAASLENGRKNLAAEEDILAKLGTYEIGVTPLEAYERDKTGDWKVTMKKRDTRGKRFVDKDTGKTVHSMEETEVFMKDEVRTAYGDELACELEFQGKGGKEKRVTLSSIVCKRDDVPVAIK